MWKENWEEAKENFEFWWQQKGCVLNIPPIKRGTQWTKIKKPSQHASPEEKFTSPDYITTWNEYNLSLYDYPADTMPIAITDWGTVCLAAVLGAEQEVNEDYSTIWYKHCMTDINKPIEFNPDNEELKRIIDCLKLNINTSKGRYLVGAPAFSSGLDTLAALYDSQEIMMNLITDREAVINRLDEIHNAYEQVMDIVNPICFDEFGGSSFYFFHLWGKGKTTQIQCDNAAMISPQMFEDYVAPYAEKQCNMFDNALFHVDGTQCLIHVDRLLKIRKLKAVEWTPQAGIEQGGDPVWYDLYKKILDSGKSVQAIAVKPNEVIPLIKAVGKNGLYINTTKFNNIDDAKALYKQVKNM